MKHLRYCMYTAGDAGELGNGHPQVVMRKLGITYFDATPQSLADQWWFWCCQNVPDPLPAFLSELNVAPREAIGRGLSAEDAEKIEAAMRAGSEP